jgi:hypothetical protein
MLRSVFEYVSASKEEAVLVQLAIQLPSSGYFLHQRRSQYSSEAQELADVICESILRIDSSRTCWESFVIFSFFRDDSKPLEALDAADGKCQSLR